MRRAVVVVVTVPPLISFLDRFVDDPEKPCGLAAVLRLGVFADEQAGALHPVEEGAGSIGAWI